MKNSLYRMTEKAVASLLERGLDEIGSILSDGKGRIALVNNGRVIWLSESEFHSLMHPEPFKLPGEEGYE